MHRLLIIRFSSLGDILQCLAAERAFRARYPDSFVAWTARSDFADLLAKLSHVDQVHSLERKQGLTGLIQMAWKLAGEPWTHVYDAHNNLRSRLFVWIFGLRKILRMDFSWQFARRPKYRLRRWILFNLHRNFFPKPFRGSESFLHPLKKWQLSQRIISQNHFKEISLEGIASEAKIIGLVPSASSANKRWPIENYVRLMELLPNAEFCVFGGPEDSFALKLKDRFPNRCQSWIGKLSFTQSLQKIEDCDLVIGSDTGLTHAADLMMKPTVFLIGPSAFGYPSSPRARVIEKTLSCKPCSKDGHTPCKNRVLQKCMRDITPEEVAKATSEILSMRA